MLLKFWHIRRCRKQISALLSLLLARKVNENADLISVDSTNSYMLGVITVLVNSVLERELISLSQDQIGYMQIMVWRDLNDINAEAVGEQIAFLSSIKEPDFIRGSISGENFSSTLLDAIPLEEFSNFGNDFDGGCTLEDICSDNPIREKLPALWEDILTEAKL